MVWAERSEFSAHWELRFGKSDLGGGVVVQDFILQRQVENLPHIGAFAEAGWKPAPRWCICRGRLKTCPTFFGGTDTSWTRENAKCGGNTLHSPEIRVYPGPQMGKIDCKLCKRSPLQKSPI